MTLWLFTSIISLSFVLFSVPHSHHSSQSPDHWLFLYLFFPPCTGITQCLPCTRPCRALHVQDWREQTGPAALLDLTLHNKLQRTRTALFYNTLKQRNKSGESIWNLNICTDHSDRVSYWVCFTFMASVSFLFFFHFYYFLNINKFIYVITAVSGEFLKLWHHNLNLCCGKG